MSGFWSLIVFSLAATQIVSRHFSLDAGQGRFLLDGSESPFLRGETGLLSGPKWLPEENSQ